jgi:LacI family repressor for deo operon, udp, cdd, tsx, nupC, and nupG
MTDGTGPPSGRRATGLDVAERAGVSQSTVSLVLAGKAAGRVSPRIQRRVKAAADELRYRPDASARALRSGRARAVGLFVPDVTNPFLGRTLRGAQSAARRAGYDVALLEPGDDRDDQLRSMESLRAGAVDGLLLFVVEPPPTEELAPLSPVVLIEAERPGVPSVALEVAAGTDALMAHLVGLGHRHIAHLACAIDVMTFRRRGDRWAAALDALGVAPVERRRAFAPFTLAGARAAARALLADGSGTGPRPTALFCDDDLLAAGARLAADDLGLRVPDDLAIAGFAGTVLSEASVPALTTVLAPAEDLGAAAMDKLLALIEGRPVEERTRLGVHLAVRGSTAPPVTPVPPVTPAPAPVVAGEGL